MFRSIVLTTFFFCLPISICTAQDHGEEVFTAVIKTMEVLERAFLESFELEMSRTQTLRLDSMKGAAKGLDLDNDEIRLTRVLNFKEKNEFSIATSSGRNSLEIPFDKSVDADPNVDYREQSTASFVYGKDEEIVLGRLSLQDLSIRESNLFKQLDEEFAMEGGCKFPMTQITEHWNPQINYIDPLIEFCSEQKNQSRILRTEEDRKDGKVFVYRIKYDPTPDYLNVHKIVVSADGVDKGLIRETHLRLLKEDQRNVPYTTDDQLNSESMQSVRIKWKEIPWGDDTSKKLIVPDRVVKRNDHDAKIKSLRSDITQFEWKPLSEESKKKISLEEAKKTTEEQLKTINKMLKR